MPELQNEDKTIFIEYKNLIFIKPRNLSEALDYKKKYPNATLLSGGSDLHVGVNKKNIVHEAIIYLADLKELKKIQKEDKECKIGAEVTISQISLELANEFKELAGFLDFFASPQIKNIAVVAGNIGNASPVGDTIPFLMVMEAKLSLQSSGNKRKVNINNFYKSYKQFDLNPDEIITEIEIPYLEKNQILKLYKNSKRSHLDISTFSAAIMITISKSGNNIESINIALGGVAAIVKRATKTEQFLIGKRLDKLVFEEASKILISEINPISDVRSTDVYRLQLAERILLRFYRDIV